MKVRFELQLEDKEKEVLREIAKNSKRRMGDYLRRLIEYAAKNKIKL